MITTRYELPASGKCLATFKQDIRIALVADLHDRPAGEVLRRLREERPDLILAAGDMMERCTEGESQYTKVEMDAWQGLRKKNKIASKAMKTAMKIGYSMHEKHDFSEGRDFLQKASQIAPVFYAQGNHEWYFTTEDQKLFSQNRIFLLDNADICWHLGKKQLVTEQEWQQQPEEVVRIGGLSTRYDLDWLSAYAKKPGYKILICHHPEYYRRYIKGTGRDTFDLIVSGHVHGGQWRIGKHGVLAPGQGLFPKYCYGCYDGKLIVSAGLSNTASVPRFGNPTELVIIDFRT